jgi:hypothetical protein
LGASSKAIVEPAKGHIDLSSYSDGITLEFWFQPATPIVDTTSGTPRPGGSTHQPIANFSTKDGNDLILCLDDKDFFFLDGIETNTLSARAYPPIKTWYHVALIYNRRGRDLKLLVDGVLQATFKLDKELVALASFGARISKDKTIASESGQCRWIQPTYQLSGNSEAAGSTSGSLDVGGAMKVMATSFSI